MMLINRSLFWKDLRKVGIIYCFFNIILQACLLLLAVYAAPMNPALALIIFYIILHLLLIYGLYSKKPTILTLWLTFVPFEIIILQAFLLYCDIIHLFFTAKHLIGTFILLLHLVLTTFLFHNVCVVSTVRHRFIHNQNGQNENCHIGQGETLMNPAITTDS